MKKNYILDTCIIIFSKEIYETALATYDCTKITEINAPNGAVPMELAGVQSVCDFYGFDLYDFLVTGDVCRKISTRWKDLMTPIIIWINFILLWRLRNGFNQWNYMKMLR